MINKDSNIKNLEEKIAAIDKAIDYFKEREQDTSSVISAQNMLKGRLAFLQGNLNSSKKAYEEAVKGFENNRMYTEMSTVAQRRGKIFGE